MSINVAASVSCRKEIKILKNLGIHPVNKNLIV